MAADDEDCEQEFPAIFATFATFDGVCSEGMPWRMARASVGQRPSVPISRATEGQSRHPRQRL